MDGSMLGSIEIALVKAGSTTASRTRPSGGWTTPSTSTGPRT
ncbi:MULTISPECIES: hypothetical protein [unclassified Streptomyces]